MRFLRFWGICEIGRVGCGQYFFCLRVVIYVLKIKHVLTCMDSFDMEILDFEGIFHECYCVFRVLYCYVDGGGAAWPLLPMWGGSAWSSAGWLGGRSLCIWFFSDVVGCGVVFFGGAVGGGVLVRAALLLLVVIGDVSREWAVWLLFSLVSRSFLMFSIIVSCGCDAQGS